MLIFDVLFVRDEQVEQSSRIRYTLNEILTASACCNKARPGLCELLRMKQQ